MCQGKVINIHITSYNYFYYVDNEFYSHNVTSDLFSMGFNILPIQSLCQRQTHHTIPTATSSPPAAFLTSSNYFQFKRRSSQKSNTWAKLTFKSWLLFIIHIYAPESERKFSSCLLLVICRNCLQEGVWSLCLQT